MVTGLLLTVASALYVQTHISVDSGYGVLLPAFILMGVGMGLVMSPMSTAAMNAVPHDKAGVASGDPVDEPHGRRHVRRRRYRRAVPAPEHGNELATSSPARASPPIGKGCSKKSAQPTTRPTINTIERWRRGGRASPPGGANEAFIHALSSAMWLSLGVALLGVVAAATLIERKRAEQPDPARQPEAEAAGAAAT